MPNPIEHKLRLIYSWKDYRDFFWYAKKRIQSEDDYFLFEKYQGRLLVRYLLSKGIPVQQSQSLDIGCGFGGYTAALQEIGTKVIGIDIESKKISGITVKVSGDARFIPFPADSFSLVICSSLIEHVPDPQKLLVEIDRILKSKGYLYLSFPPFYSPVGGHQFSPFHYLGEHLAISIFMRNHKYKNQEWVKRYVSFTSTSYRTSFGTWGLYPRTISLIKSEVRKFSWDIIECSTRYSPINFASLPVLGEFLTWHVQFLIQKK